MASTRSGLSYERSILSSGSSARLKRKVAFVGTGGGGAGLGDPVGVVGGPNGGLLQTNQLYKLNK